MSYICECHQVGGPWIAEDPNCPTHGHGGTDRLVDEHNERIEHLERIMAGLITQGHNINMKSNDLILRSFNKVDDDYVFAFDGVDVTVNSKTRHMIFNPEIDEDAEYLYRARISSDLNAISGWE